MLDSAFYRSLYRVRRVEEEIARVYPTDKVMSPVHLSIGQEAISVAVCEALQPDDVVFGTYRGHALYLAKGGDLPGMIAELYGKATGVAKGKAGSMHLIDTSSGVMGASAVVATSIPQAVGYALALKLQRKPQIVAAFFGDGAVEEGVFHESLNFAALKRLPILFICENNDYAIHSRRRDRQAGEQILGYAQAHGLAAERFPQMDIYELYARTCCVAEELRTGRSAPVFFECCCCRWMEHVGPHQDFAAGYRDPADAEVWFQNDPLQAVGRRLVPELRKQLEQEVEEEIHVAFEFAEQSAFPDPRELYSDMYG